MPSPNAQPPITVTIPADLWWAAQSVGGYDPQSDVSDQRQFEAIFGLLLVLWSSLSPLEQQVYRRIIQESDDIERGDASQN